MADPKMMGVDLADVQACRKHANPSVAIAAHFLEAYRKGHTVEYCVSESIYETIADAIKQGAPRPMVCVGIRMMIDAYRIVITSPQFGSPQN